MRSIFNMENMKCKADMDYDLFSVEIRCSSSDPNNSASLRDTKKKLLRTCICKKSVDMNKNFKKIMDRLALDNQDSKRWGFIAPCLETSYLLNRSFECSCGLSINVEMVRSRMSVNVLLFESIVMFHIAMYWMFSCKSDKLEHQITQDVLWKDFLKERTEDLYLFVILGFTPDIYIDRESLNVPFLKNSEYFQFSSLTPPGSIVRTKYNKKTYIFEGMSEVTAENYSFNNELYLNYMHKAYTLNTENPKSQLASVRDFTLNPKYLNVIVGEDILVRNRTLLSPEQILIFPLSLDFLFRGSILIPIFKYYKRLTYVFHFVKSTIGIQLPVDLVNEALTDKSLSEESNYKHLSPLGDSVLNCITILPLFDVCSSVAEIESRYIPLINNKFLASIFEDVKLDRAVDFCRRGKKLPGYTQLSTNEKAGLIEALLCTSFIAGGIEEATELLSKISPRHKQLFNDAAINKVVYTFSAEDSTHSLKNDKNKEEFRHCKDSRMHILQFYSQVVNAEPKTLNRKLALLGDSCLDLLVMWSIFKKCHFVRPSQASIIRSKLVSNSHLTKLTAEYGLIDQLACILSPSITKNLSDKFFGNLLESIAGAIFVDLNNSMTSFIQLFEPLFEKDIVDLLMNFD